MEHPHSILVIDDDDDAREMMTEWMRVQGAERVRGASDGADGMVQLLTGFLPCMILLDMRMGGIDGAEFLRLQSQDTTLCGIPVIIISGVVWPLVSVVVASLLKPVNLAELGQLITKHCTAAASN